jgi:hypothetical protein
MAKQKYLILINNEVEYRSLMGSGSFYTKDHFGVIMSDDGKASPAMRGKIDMDEFQILTPRQYRRIDPINEMNKKAKLKLLIKRIKDYKQEAEFWKKEYMKLKFGEK